mgnify:CR=1 FL=1
MPTRAAARIAQTLAVIEPALVAKVMRFDPCRRDRIVAFGHVIDRVVLGQKGHGHAFPAVPGACCRAAHRRVGVVEQVDICLQQVAVAAFPRVSDERLPLLGVELACAVLVKPVCLVLPGQEDPAQDQLADPFRVGLGIGQA